jgi:hypothetical protein
MRALRGVFFFVAAAAACFSDSSVKPEVYKAGRVLLVISGVLFMIAEAMELLA